MRFLLWVLMMCLTMPAFAHRPSYIIENTTTTDVYVRHDRPIRHDNYSWESYHGYIPANAVVGGEEDGRELFICQADYMNAAHPGKVVDGLCHITYGGREIPKHHFRILTGDGFDWLPGDYDEVPRHAVVGGEENGQPLFICQARFAHGMHPGKVVAGKCNFGYDGHEITSEEYNILVMSRGQW